MSLWEFVVKHWLGVLFGLVSTALGAILRALTERRKKGKGSERSMQEGLVAQLSTKLLDMHSQYHERGCCPYWAKKSVEQLYKAYHDLGGNGAITEAVQQLMELPMEKSDNNMREDA